MKRVKMKTTALITMIMLIVSLFGFSAYAVDFTKFEAVDGAVTLDGTNPGTVTVYWESTATQDIYNFEGYWDLTDGTGKLTLTDLTSETVTFGALDELNAGIGKAMWTDDTFSNPLHLSVGSRILSATYSVAADTPAGTYTVNYKSVVLTGDDYNPDTTETYYTANIVVTGSTSVTDPAKPVIDVTGTYTYNGADQTATVTGYDSATMNITGNVGKNAGSYTVSVTSKTGAWADGTTEAVTKGWSIAKAIPTVTDPTGLNGTKGNALSTVTLPTGWAWKIPATVMNETGSKTFAAIYTPNDTVNYNTKEANLTVNVSEPPVTDPAKPVIDVTGTYTYNGADQTATVTGYDSATMNITGNVGKNAGSYTVSVTSKTGAWADGTTEAVTKGWSIAKAIPTGNPKYTSITTAGKTLADAALTTTGATFSVDGTVKWIDYDGSELADTTIVVAKTYYKWLFTPTDTANYETLTGTIRLYYKSSGGGGVSITTNYTVTFDTNGGSKITSQSVTKNAAVKEPTVPTKENFDFAGWYTDKEFKTKYDFSEKVTKSFTLYAKWNEKDNSINQIILTVGKKDAKVFGKTISNDVAPKIVNSRTMLPARFVAESLGAKVEWNGEKELVTITGKNEKNENVTILVTIGAASALVNGKEVKLDSPAFIENDRTYTPIRFISELLGATVDWDGENQIVTITKAPENK